MRTPEEINKTPVLLLTAEEIEQLSPDLRPWVRRAQAQAAREKACPNHEPVGTSTRNGYHSLRCKHCDMDMSCDSGD
jgi:hypothetical protein